MNKNNSGNLSLIASKLNYIYYYLIAYIFPHTHCFSLCCYFFSSNIRWSIFKLLKGLNM